jgi:outer membrane protein TolC
MDEPIRRYFYMTYAILKYGICLPLLFYFASIGALAQVPGAVTVPNPVELPNPPRRPVQFAGYAITLDKAVNWFLEQNPEIQSARERLERARSAKTSSTESTDAETMRAELELAEVTRRGLLELKTCFYQAVLARLLIYEAQENLTYLDNYIKRMQARYEEAIAPESEVTKWRLERARVTDAIAEAKLAERLARIKFFLLLGKADSTIFGELLTYLDEAPATPMKFTVEELFEIGLRERPELREPELLARPASKASSTGKKQPTGEAIDPRSGKATASVIRNRIFAEIESAYAVTETHRERAIAIKSQQIAQSEYLRGVAASYYNENETPLITLLEAQRTRWEVRQQYRRALCAYHTSLAELEAAVGKQLKEIEP